MIKKILSDKQVQEQKLANYMLVNYDSKDWRRHIQSCDIIALKTLTLTIDCIHFRWLVRKQETISTKDFAFLIITLWSFFWSLFSRIWTEYGKIRTRNNSVFGRFSHSGKFLVFYTMLGFMIWFCMVLFDFSLFVISILFF